MASIYSIVRHLNSLYNIKNIPDVSKNGTQHFVKKDIKKIGFAVDGAMSTFKKAAKLKCDMLIVHHGIFWKGQRDDFDLIENYKKYLKKRKIALWACHLPMDAHEKYGHNA